MIAQDKGYQRALHSVKPAVLLELADLAGIH